MTKIKDVYRHKELISFPPDAHGGNNVVPLWAGRFYLFCCPRPVRSTMLEKTVPIPSPHLLAHGVSDCNHWLPPLALPSPLVRASKLPHSVIWQKDSHNYCPPLRDKISEAAWWTCIPKCEGLAMPSTNPIPPGSSRNQIFLTSLAHWVGSENPGVIAFHRSPACE